MDNFENQILNIMQIIKQCYTERKDKNIEKFMNHLFDPEIETIIIGTSNNEWEFGLKNARELFVSDWSNWGNVTIDSESLLFEDSLEYAWLQVKSSVEYCFDDNEDTYNAFMEMVHEIAHGERSELSRSTEIIWLLSHLLHTRKQGERKYVWDMNISCILQKLNQVYKVKIMQFSIPVLSMYSDVRIDFNADDKHLFSEECRKIHNYNQQLTIEPNNIRQHICSLFTGNEKIGFVDDNIKRYIGIDGVRRTGNEFEDYILAYIQNKNINLIPENIIVEKSAKQFCFCGVGTFSRNISLEKDLNFVLNNIGFYNGIPSKKDGLFMLRRDLTQVLKETSLSDTCIEPFRIEGIGKYEKEKGVTFSYLQISFPFNCVLEQKTDASREI